VIADLSDNQRGRRSWYRGVGRWFGSHADDRTAYRRGDRPSPWKER